MGLDMYLKGQKYYWTNHTPTEDGYEVKEKSLRIGYWRKHPNLHGFIVNTFADGKDDCSPIELSIEDVEKILEAVKADQLPHTTGFFFGSSDWHKPEETIEILTKAIEWAKTEENGVSRSIVYEASW